MRIIRLWVAAACLAGAAGCSDSKAAETPGSVPLPPGFKSDFADVGGIKIHYVVGGQGDPLVLVHGWPQTWFEWHRIMPELAQRYTVVVPDLRGAGESDAPPAGYDKKTMAEDVYAVLTKLGLPPANVVGHDIGMMVAYALAARHPAAVKKLVLVDAGIPGIDPVGSPVIPRILWHFGFHNERDLPEALVAGRERVYMVSFFQRYAVNKEAFTAEEVDHFVASYARPGRMTAGFEWYRAFDGDAAYNKAELFPTKLPMPTLVVGGGAFGTTTAQLQALGDMIATTARAALLLDSGHWIAEEQPEKFVALVRDFIEGGVQ